MKIYQVQNINNTKFGMKDVIPKLSEETLKLISESTKLSVDQMHRLPMDEAHRIMKERGAFKEPSKLKLWLADKYKQFGEKTGLLKKQVNYYTDID